MNAEILLVEDERNVRELIVDLLSSRGFSVIACESLAIAEANLEKHLPDALVLDVRLGDGDGLAFLEQLRKRGVRVPAVIITAVGTVDRAVQALRAGASDFVLKPFDNDRLVASVQSAVGVGEQLAESELMGGAVDGKGPLVPELVGASSGLRELGAALPRIAASECTVLIRGESGTGKEVIARALHSLSPRRDGPFIAVNCAALPPALLESELFGFERGAFTGAHARKKGLIEAADGGTLFLDEIGDMPVEAQTRLLRVLQERELTRVGATSAEKIDVRVLAATHRDLEQLSADGRFRQDLMFRLAVVPVDVPPLRSRKQDIPGLVSHFLSKHRALAPNAVLPTPDARFFADAQAHEWPGNVRELENCVQRAIVLGQFVAPAPLRSDKATPTEPAAPPVTKSAAVRALRDAVAEAEREAVLAALQASRGNKAEAARLLGVSYKTLFNKLHEHGIKEELSWD